MLLWGGEGEGVGQKDYDYEDHSVNKVEHAFSVAIDQLALKFSGRYLLVGWGGGRAGRK